MLILTRGLGETLVIGDDVTVTVLGVRGKRIQQKKDIVQGANSGPGSGDQPP